MRMNWSEKQTTTTTKQNNITFEWMLVHICAKCELRNPHNLQKAYGFPNDMNGFLLREDKRISLLLCVHHEPTRFIVCIFFPHILFYQLWLSDELNLKMQQSWKHTNKQTNNKTCSFNYKTIAYEILAVKWMCTHNYSKFDFHSSNNDRINNYHQIVNDLTVSMGQQNCIEFHWLLLPLSLS